MIKDEVVLETKRLVLRKLKQDDFSDVCDMLQDLSVMYAWEKVFTDEEVKIWLKHMQARYELDGFAYYLAINKKTKEVIGQVGLLKEVIDARDYVGLGYMLKRRYWGQGYAKEACNGCLQYAFEILKADAVIAEIRPSNTRSLRVAQSLGMSISFTFDKIYNEKVFPHLVYEIKKGDSFLK